MPPILLRLIHTPSLLALAVQREWFPLHFTAKTAAIPLSGLKQLLQVAVVEELLILL